MVVCIRKNSELKKMCEEYKNNKNLSNTLEKINNLLEKLIKTRKGFFTTMGAKAGLTKIELNLKEFPTYHEIQILFKNNFFIEPYCEFLTCLYFNQDIYFIFNPNTKADFDLYILNIYKTSKEIINNLNNDDFINLFLRINNKNNLVVRLNNNNKNNLVVRLNNKNSYNKLKNFYESIKKITKKNNNLIKYYKEQLSGEKYKAYRNKSGKINKNKTKMHSGINYSYTRNTQQLSYATNRLNNLNKYNEIIDDLIYMINICNGTNNIINKNNTTNRRRIIRLSISMFKSYNLLRIYYNKYSNKEIIKSIIKQNISVIKQKYIDNLFRFQFDYIYTRKIIKIEFLYYGTNNTLIDFIKFNEDKNINELKNKLITSYSSSFQQLYSMIGPFAPLPYIIIGTPLLAFVTTGFTVVGILTLPYSVPKLINTIYKKIYGEPDKLTDFDNFFLEYFPEYKNTNVVEQFPKNS